MTDADSQEKARVKNLYRIEEEYYQSGTMLIAGIDEVGRGPLAGPVVASAVILKPYTFLSGLNDSKLLSEKQRKKLNREVINGAVAVGIGEISVALIDKYNIFEATKMAMMKAVENLGVTPDFLLIDAVSLDLPIPQLNIIKGDRKSASIAAASIVAKVYRDALMQELDKKYPLYGFCMHKGYCTKGHLAALAQHGPCPDHRRSFAPVKHHVKQ